MHTRRFERTALAMFFLAGCVTFLGACIAIERAHAQSATTAPQAQGRNPAAFTPPSLERAPSTPPPAFNPSSPYTVPQSGETPVSPASPGSVFGSGSSTGR
jgi:hypothetical protein